MTIRGYALPKRKKKISRKKILRLEIPLHPPYSTNLASTDFRFFRSLAHFLRDRIFRNKDVGNRRSIFSGKNPDFFKHRIESLPSRWPAVVEHEADCFLTKNI